MQRGQGESHIQAMYIPKHYLAEEQEEVLGFIKTYNFATIVTVKDNFQSATHLPFVITESEGQIVLTSHFAKANPQWSEITDNPVLVIFSEPHAYISPSHYESKQNVPTWNYVAVHAYGKGELITGEEESFSVLEAMIHAFEQEYKSQWDQLNIAYKTKMLKGIVAFRIIVTEIQAKKKLSQNKKATERQRIIATLEQSNDNGQQAIAELMRQNDRK